MRDAIYAVIFCSLLAVATPASAACAWVLWEKVAHSHDPKPVWTITDTDEDRRICEMALSRALESAKPSDGSMRIKASGKDWLLIVPVKASPAEMFSVHFSYRCLPDTVDPRGPKEPAR